MPRHVLFVTTELVPWVPGGAGTLLARIRQTLIGEGHTATTLLVAPAVDGLPDDVIAVGTAPDFEGRSSIAADAIAEMVAARQIDLIEIQDFDGLGHGALCRRSELGIESLPVQVRFHGTADLMFEAIGIEPAEIAVARAMERGALAMADAVVVPSPAVASLVADRYGVEADRIVVGTPPVPEAPEQSQESTASPLIVSVGRLSEVKGTHDLVAAAVPVLRSHPAARLRIIGPDGWSATAQRPMAEWLATRIPGDVAGRIEITGPRYGPALGDAVAGAWFAVHPSRFDSFSLAAHEARLRGLPVVVPDIAAFRGMLDEGTGALVYDGTRKGLTAAMERMLRDEALRSRLAAAPVPTLGDPMAPYLGSLPGVRHQRSQAGLATAATKRLQEARPVARRPSRLQRPAAALLRVIPRPVAGLAMRLMPARLKDRFRAVASWPGEVARREAARRRAEIEALIAGGEFGDVGDPRVSVVIPCFDQGAYVEDAILSVFAQTYRSWEIVVVDDGSTDAATIDALDRLSRPRTRLVRQSNGGLSAARNAGIAAGRGEFIVPLDADDELEPAFLERLVAALDSHPSAAVASCYARLFGDIDAVWVPRPYNPYQLLLSNPIVGCVLMRRPAVEAVGGYDATMRSGNEDWELWVRLMAAGHEFTEVAEPLFRYRKHGVSMSVETESRFEEGRTHLVARHRDLYAAEQMRARKRRHYPLVAVVVDENRSLTDLEAQDLDDVEVIDIRRASLRAEVRPGEWSYRIAESLRHAVEVANAKYLVHWRMVEDADRVVLGSLAAALEDAPGAGSASTSGTEPITMIRRWSVLDPAGPATEIAIDGDGHSRGLLTRGAFPDPRWAIPPQIDGLPVQRQRPEEDGRIPEWAAL